MKKEEPPEFDMLGAVRAVNRGMKILTVSARFGLSQAQDDDLRAHVEACERVRRGEMPTLTPFERASVVKYYTPLDTPASWHIRRNVNGG